MLLYTIRIVITSVNQGKIQGNFDQNLTTRHFKCTLQSITNQLMIKHACGTTSLSHFM